MACRPGIASIPRKRPLVFSERCREAGFQPLPVAGTFSQPVNHDRLEWKRGKVRGGSAWLSPLSTSLRCLSRGHAYSGFRIILVTRYARNATNDSRASHLQFSFFLFFFFSLLFNSFCFRVSLRHSMKCYVSLWRKSRTEPRTINNLSLFAEKIRFLRNGTVIIASSNDVSVKLHYKWKVFAQYCIGGGKKLWQNIETIDDPPM